MRFLAVLVLLAATLSFAPSASATADLPVGVNDCDGSNVCAIVGTAPPCIGAGLGLQGAKVCVDDKTQCVRAYVGFNVRQVCAPGIVIGPLPCDMLSTGCPWPILIVEDETKCAGAAFAGTNAGVCVVTSGGETCVIYATQGGAYWRECIATD